MERGEDDFYSDGFRIIHLGAEEHERGVATILHVDKRTAKTIKKIRCEGDRLLLMKLKGIPVDVIIVRLCFFRMPLVSHDSVTPFSTEDLISPFCQALPIQRL